MSLHLQGICRICLRSAPLMHSLLESIVPKLDSPPNAVLDLWKIFTKTLIATVDRYPDKLCPKCLVDIQQSYSCMLRCQRSTDILTQMQNSERLKQLETASTLQPSTSKNIKWKILQVNSDKRQFQVVSHANVASQIASRSQHSPIVKQEDDSFEIELLNDLDYENNDTMDEISTIQDIKQEPDLNYENNDTMDEASAIQYIKQEPDQDHENVSTTDKIVAIEDIKQEPDLDKRVENYEFDEIESKNQASTEIIACPTCRFECRIVGNLEKHIIDKHMEGRMCIVCNQEFECSAIDHCSKHLLEATNRKGSFTSNLWCRTEEGRFKCKICSTTFRHKKNLMEHSRHHTGERFRCQLCSKTFVSKYNLLKHFKCHTEERLFKCQTCPKSFIKQKRLMHHVKFHAVERPFKCPSCPKAYRGEGGLTEHTWRCHMTEPPFKCESCPESFVNKNELRSHMIVKHRR